MLGKERGVLIGVECLQRMFGTNITCEGKAEKHNFKRTTVKFYVQMHLLTVSFVWTQFYMPIISALGDRKITNLMPPWAT